MNPIHDLRGIVTVLNTPFDEDNGLDLAGLAANVENAIQAGVEIQLAMAEAPVQNAMDRMHAEDLDRHESLHAITAVQNNRATLTRAGYHRDPA